MERSIKSAGFFAIAPASAAETSGESATARTIRDPVNRAENLFSHIAAKAHAVGQLLSDANQSEGELQASLIQACAALVDQIGWTADVGSKSLHGIQIKGDAEAWLLPPFCQAFIDPEAS